VSEAYPSLKSDQNFLALQSQLEGTENRIAVARRDYIIAVQSYNTELRTIPGRWMAVAALPDAKVKETFTIAEQTKQVAPGQILMRTRWAILLLIFVAVIAASPALAAEPKFPALSGRVVDDANVLTSSTQTELTDMLAAHERCDWRASCGGHARLVAGISDRGLRLPARPLLGDRAKGQETPARYLLWRPRSTKFGSRSATASKEN